MTMEKNFLLSRLKAIALAKQRGQRTISLLFKPLAACILLVGSVAWAAPNIQVFEGTTEIKNAQTTSTDFLSIFGAPSYPPVTKTFTVKNVGGEAVNITGLTTVQSGAVFSNPAVGTTVIQPGASTTFVVTFTPTTPPTGEVAVTVPLKGLPTATPITPPIISDATVQIFLSDSTTTSSLFSFPLAGITATASADLRILDGTTEIQDSATVGAPPRYRTVDLGKTNLGNPLTKTFTLKNVGKAPTAALTIIAAPTMAGTTPVGEFTVTSDFTAGTVLQPGQSTTFKVTLQAKTGSPATPATPWGASIKVAEATATGVLSAASTAASMIFPTTDGSPPVPPYVAGDTYAALTFGVIGTVTPLPEIEVLDGAINVTDNTGEVDLGMLLKGEATKNIKIFTVRNLGGLALNLKSPIEVTNTSGSGFSLGSDFIKTQLAAATPAPPTPPTTIDSTNFQIKLDTSQSGTFEALVSFGNDDGDENPYNFKVKGAIVESPLQEIEVYYGTPAEVAAGTAKPITSGIGATVGTEVDFSTPMGTDVTKTFTVKNIGGAPLPLFYLSTPLPTGFSLASIFPSVVAPGGTASFDIKLNAATAGQYGGTLYIFNDDKASDSQALIENPFNFRVKATVKAPAPEIQVLDDASTDIDISIPTKINFGTKPRGTNVPKIFTVKNIGDKELNLTSPVTVTGTGFSGLSFNPGTLAPNATTNFTVILDASTPGTFIGEVSFTNNDDDETTFKFPITAIVDNTPPANQAIEVWYGTPADITANKATPITDGTTTTPGTAIDLTSTLPNGSTPVGAKIIKTFTVRNIGSKDLNLFGASQLDGIKVVGTLPFNVPAGGEVTFEVELDATVAGKKGGTFQLFNNDSSKTPFDFPLTGMVGSVTPPASKTTLTVTVKGNGSVDSTDPVGIGITNCTVAAGPACTKELPAGTTSVTLTAKGGAVAWSGADCKVGTTPETAIVTVPTTATTVACTADFTGAVANIPLTVKVTGNGNVNSTTPAGIGIANCAASGGICTGNIPTGTTSVILTATPAAGETVTWGPGCAAGTEANTGTVSIGSNTTSAECSVNFVTGTSSAALTVTVVGPGTVNAPTGITNCTLAGGVNCTANFPAGTVILTATPAAGEPVTWSNGCTAGTTTNTATVNIVANTPAACTATFATNPTPTGSKLQVFDGTTEIMDGSTTPINFGTTKVGQPLTKTLTVKNASTDIIDLFGYTIPEGFSIGTYPAGVAGKVDFTFEIQLNTSVAGKFEGPVKLFNSADPKNPFDFMISGEVTTDGGTAMVPEIQVLDGTTDILDGATTSTDFGVTGVGSPVTKTFTVKNAGKASLNLTSAAKLASGNGFTVESFNPVPTTLAPDGTMTFKVTLTAATEGQFVGVVSFGNNDSNENPFDFPISGAVTQINAQEKECFEQGSMWNGKKCVLIPELTAGTNTGTPTNTKMKGGISKSEGGQFTPFKMTDPTISMAMPVITAGVLKVDSSDIGKSAGILAAGLYKSSIFPKGFEWYTLVTCSACPTGWRVDILAYDETTTIPLLTRENLLPFDTVDKLPAYYTVNLYEGLLPYPGELDIYFGYRVDEGDKVKVVYSQTPIHAAINP
ncbi:hypothetical protein THII_3333 [Thioploca ingrica]|uniref:HYDIN/VesB/CFA65-like Ig-like domain-containing protein n=1 Tax=Thioploca ingrica TaxID=40754 RepID=A0A090APX3_9GAMM|nr:hypothetical protein THII_3333 [Thioploca ingrica]